MEIYIDNVQLVTLPNTATPAPQFTPTETSTSNGSETPTSTSTPTESPTPTPTLPVAPVGQLSQAKYTYDGDGNLVKSEVTSMVNDVASVTVTYYAGKHYNEQVTGEVTKKQKTYSFGSQTVALRTIINDSQNWLTWVLTDNLGSTSVTANADGSFNSEIRYSAFGEIRYSSGTTPTNYKYTGQLSQPELGLDFYVARWYDPVTAHFVQADTYIPDSGKSQTFDRYMYVKNNPIRYNDPSGHRSCDDDPYGCRSADNGYSDGGTGSTDTTEEIVQTVVGFIPVIGDVNRIAQGVTLMHQASQLSGFYEQESRLQSWYGNCSGVCHGWAKYNPSVGFQYPTNIPAVDLYSEGSADVVSGALGLFYTAFFATRPAESDVASIFGKNFQGKKFPLNWDSPYLYRSDDLGYINNYAKYNVDGKIEFRVDLAGSDHNVGLPHTHFPDFNIGKGGAEIFNDWLKPVKGNPRSIIEILFGLK